MTHLLQEFRYVTYVPEEQKLAHKGQLSFIAIKKGPKATPGTPDTIIATEGSVVKNIVHITQLIPKAGELGRFTLERLTLPAFRAETLSDFLSKPFIGFDFAIGQTGHAYTHVNENLYEIKRAQGGILGLQFQASGAVIEIKETPGVEPSIFETLIPGEINLIP